MSLSGVDCDFTKDRSAAVDPTTGQGFTIFTSPLYLWTF